MNSQLCNRYLSVPLAKTVLCVWILFSPLVSHALARIELLPTGLGGPYDQMGSSVGLTGDTAVVGAPGTQVVPGVPSGVVDVFRQENGSWNLEAILSGGDGTTGFGGVAVGPGIIVVEGVAGGLASLFTFERDGSAWTQVDEFSPSGSGGLALSGDTLVSGGAVYVRNGSGWQLQTTLLLDQDESFEDVAIDGDLITASGGTFSIFGSDSHVYFFSRSGTTWTREAKWELGGGAPRVAISGQTSIASFPKGELAGGVRVFGRDDQGVWSDQGILDAGADFYGQISVSLQGDRAVVGSNGDGTAYTFTRSNGVWSREYHFNDPTFAGCFGVVSLAGSYVLAGCPGAITAAGGYGKADLFSLDENPPSVVAEFDQGNAHANESFGGGVALSGSTLLAGSMGSAYVFEHSNAGWVQEARLSPDSGLSEEFANPLALDGDTAAVANYGSPDQAVKIHTRAGGTWSLQATLSSGSNDFDYFGWALALQGDSLAVGQPEIIKGLYTTKAGSCHVFVRSGIDWSEQASIQPADGTVGDEFCFSVALSGDTLLVGAPHSDTGIETDAGAAYVFVRSGTTWTQQARLVAPLVATHAGFGVSVAIKGDTAVIGAGQDDPQDSDRGAAYVYKRSGDTWTWQATLVPPVTATPYSFGRWIALSDTGNKILASAPLGLLPGDHFGFVFAFVYDGSQWTPGPVLQGAPPFQPNYVDFFGTGVAFSGEDFAIGAPGDGSGGAVYQGTLAEGIFGDGFDSSP